jgi:glycosyltransferase involved in cell wall biosynthesis
MRSELVVTTYNAPRFLGLVLAAIARQDRLPDSIAIADDGSGDETRHVLERFRANHPAPPLRHVWHPDRGFRKNRILNRTIATSDAEHMIFIDGDCLAAPGFIRRHRALAGPGRFATGSVIRLSPETTAAIAPADVSAGRIFAPAWLARKGELAGLSRRLKAAALPPALNRLLDCLSPIRPTWSGGNASTLRAQLLAVNGFDETMAYGGEDKELGARLVNAGLRGRHLRYSAPLLHLDHGRGYVDPDIVAANRSRILETRRSGRVRAEQGLAELDPADTD